MEIKNLKVGETIKNYKELCKIIGIPEKAGNTRKAQLKELSRYCDYSKNGHIFIINEIYEEPLVLLKGNNVVPFIDEMELLIINMLIKSNMEHYTISNSRLLLELYMVNPNFTKFFNNRTELSDILSMNIDYVNEFLDSTNKTFRSAIETACRRLESRKLIIHERVMMVNVLDPEITMTPNGYAKVSDVFMYDEGEKKYIHRNSKPKSVVREASEMEKQIIIKIENEIMNDEFGCANLGMIYEKGCTLAYYRRLNQELYKQLNIKSHYMANKFTIHYEAIRKQSIPYLNQIQQLEQQKALNMKVIERLIHNGEKRKDKALTNKDDKEKSSRVELRLNNEYMNNIQLLTDILVSQEYIELKKKKKQVDMEDVSEFILDALPDNM